MKSTQLSLIALPLLTILLSGCEASAEPLAERKEAYTTKARPLSEPWTLASGKEQRLLLEMYTALNCPACPPADAWIDFFAESDLAKGKASDLWTKLVPVVWHVTYFDRPGLKDPLGTEAGTKRQEYLAQSLALDSLYTPSFFTDGKEWKGLREGKPLALANATSGELKLANLGGDRGMTIEFTPAPGYDVKAYQGELRGWLVLQVGGIYTDLRRGPEAVQPRPSTFAVQDWKSARITEKDGKWTGTFDALALEKVRQQWPDATLSVAAWVTNDALAYNPIQAVGTWVK